MATGIILLPCMHKLKTEQNNDTTVFRHWKAASTGQIVIPEMRVQMR